MSDAVMTTEEAKHFCDKIQLSEFNQIQSHGGLIVIDKNLCVIQYSENVVNIVDTPFEQLLNSPITNFLESENVNENAATWIFQKNNMYKRMDWNAPNHKIKIWVYAHHVPEGIILEIEPLIENDIEDNTLFDLTQRIVNGIPLITSSQNIQELLQNACQEIKKITGYDRVMIYQFDEYDDSGVVVGEAISTSVESYLGLHFPANDIPRNVRSMYLKMPIRYIPTIDYKQEKILPEINPITKRYLDLSSVSLRMVAPVHIQYLKNMGVASAISIAIIHNDKLWGLIACHHKNPKYLSVNFRLILTLIGNTLGIQVASLVCSKEFHSEQRAAALLSSLTEDMYKEDSLFYALDCTYRNIMELVGATGMSVYFQNNLLNYGETPTHDQVMGLIETLDTNAIHAYFATSSLPMTFVPSMNYKDKACGLLVIPIIRFQPHYMLFYRPEIIHSIFWAGNPADSLKCHGDQYSPRDSFERFMQTITNQAVPWASHDIKAAEFIRSTVVNKQLQDLLQVQAMHDPLTGLLNRLYLDQRLEIELNRAEHESYHLAIMIIDLDLFKKFNDNFGHQAGDYVLTEFATFLKNYFKEDNYIYRYGGEEFLILLPHMHGPCALQKAEILRGEIKKLKLQFLGVALPPISISAGIAIYPNDGLDGRSLIAAADKALYAAKSTGRDKVMAALVH